MYKKYISQPKIGVETRRGRRGRTRDRRPGIVHHLYSRKECVCVKRIIIIGKIGKIVLKQLEPKRSQ